MGAGVSSNFASVSEYSDFYSQVEQTCTPNYTIQQDFLTPISLDNCKDVQITLINQSSFRYVCQETDRLNAHQSNLINLNQAAKAGWFGNANNTSITDAVSKVEQYINQNCSQTVNQQQVIDAGISCKNVDKLTIKEYNTSTSSGMCALLADTSVVQSNAANIIQKASGVDLSSDLMTIVWVLVAVIGVAIVVPILVSALGKSAKSITSDIGESASNIVKGASKATTEIQSSVSVKTPK